MSILQNCCGEHNGANDKVQTGLASSLLSNLVSIKYYNSGHCPTNDQLPADNQPTHDQHSTQFHLKHGEFNEYFYTNFHALTTKWQQRP
jgi:hypothetical protein